MTKLPAWAQDLSSWTRRQARRISENLRLPLNPDQEEVDGFREDSLEFNRRWRRGLTATSVGLAVFALLPLFMAYKTQKINGDDLTKADQYAQAAQLLEANSLADAFKGVCEAEGLEKACEKYEALERAQLPHDLSEVPLGEVEILREEDKISVSFEEVHAIDKAAIAGAFSAEARDLHHIDGLERAGRVLGSFGAILYGLCALYMSAGCWNRVRIVGGIIAEKEMAEVAGPPNPV